jgi:cysteine synthase A
MSESSTHPESGIVGSVLDLVGATPLVRLNRLVGEGHAEVLVKLESYNPGGSVKDRIARAMIEAAEADGRLQPGDTIVEPTSGNTGIGLALVAAVKGYRVIITMPDDKSNERRKLLEHLGAQVVLTPARKLMKGAIDRAQQIVDSNPRCFMPQQFHNAANPEAHRQTTAQEILEATDRRLDVFVAAVGTGGTLTGVGSVLRAELPAVQIVAIEPSDSPALRGGETKPHAIQGIGAGFVPDILDVELIDRILACDDATAFETSRALAREEGILAGLSAGANVWGALEIAKELGPEQRVVTVVCDGWERYVSMEKPLGLIPGLDFII